jgi:hypothetical protein
VKIILPLKLQERAGSVRAPSLEFLTLPYAANPYSPGHPAPLFLEALIVYWENFPLSPSKNKSSEFNSLLDCVIDLSQKLRNDSLTNTEEVFFDLFGRAFKAMFWADNGKPGKLVPDLAESLGPYVDTYRAMAYMGISRLFKKQGRYSDSEAYAFILEDQFAPAM